MRPRSITAVAAVTAALALTACGSSSSSSSSVSTTSTGAASSASSSSSAAAPAASVKSGRVAVAISSYAYHPAKLVIKPGTKVTFTNHDQTAHTATASGSGRGFDSGTIKPGASATVTFSKPGTYAYICQFHAFMHGTIVVAK